MKWKKRKIFRIIWITFGLSFFLWLVYSYQSKEVDPEVLLSNPTVTVEVTDDIIAFTPKQEYENIIIFFPGAMVEPIAYAPFSRKLADSGNKVIIIKMPFRLASRGYNLPKEMKMFSEEPKQYILAGHSLGAKMAAQFTYENPTLVDKLILLGTTHPRDISLADISIPVLKISGSHDGVAPVEKTNINKPNLPASTKYILIEGANHSQFGHYGSQLGDDKASISRDKQQQQVIDHIRIFL
ncbi:MAG: alpha/beta hydrolase [Candidatus Cyclobacteriaceae bacterium M2_1C_046]